MSEHNPYGTMHATTIITVRKGGKVVMAGDGQVSLGQTVMKGNARKVRRLSKGDVIAGFAGATADALHASGTAGGEARAISRPADARGRRARQGLAYQQVSAQSRGDDAGCRPGR
jgi:hypothetical protein